MTHPIVVSYGGGTNSTALLILIRDRGDRGEGQAPPTRVKGLGRHWNWATFDGSDAGTSEPCMVCLDGYPEDLT